MTPPFSVRTPVAFERGLEKLARKHAELRAVFKHALTILETDPYNRSRAHKLKKLQGVAEGNGQWRLRVQRWRFRYDIFENQVVLSDCSLRREDTYK